MCRCSFGGVSGSRCCRARWSANTRDAAPCTLRAPRRAPLRLRAGVDHRRRCRLLRSSSHHPSQHVTPPVGMPGAHKPQEALAPSCSPRTTTRSSSSRSSRWCAQRTAAARRRWRRDAGAAAANDGWMRCSGGEGQRGARGDAVRAAAARASSEQRSEKQEGRARTEPPPLPPNPTLHHHHNHIIIHGINDITT